MRVLLAVHDLDLHLALELLLREEPGVTIVGTARDAEGLLALVPVVSPDLLLLDWELSARPGGDLLEKVRRVDPRPAIVVLGNPADAEEMAQAAGIDAVVLKGDPPEQLLAAVRRVRFLSGVPADQIPGGMEGA